MLKIYLLSSNVRIEQIFYIQNNGTAEILVDGNSFGIRENVLKKFFKLIEEISYKSIVGKLITESPYAR
jgi:hypothetical protein